MRQYLITALLGLVIAGSVVARVSQPPVAWAQGVTVPGVRVAPSATYPTIQEAINAGPGVVMLPPGSHVILTPLVIPNTDLSGRGGVRLVGSGRLTTYLVGGAGFSGPALITRAPANYATNSRRTWGITLSGFTMVLPKTNGAGVLIDRTDPTAGATYEKATLHVSDIGCESLVDYAQVCFDLRGMLHDVVFQDVDIDPGGAGGAFVADTIGIRADDGPDDGLDTGGVYSGRFEGITVTPRRGGGGTAFTGRCQTCTFRDIMIGRGTAGPPVIRLVGSWGVTISELVTEGRLETAQVLIENSRFISVRALIGTPDTGGGPGVELRDCWDCQVELAAHPDKVLWAVPRLRIDAASRGTRYRVSIGANNWGQEVPTAAVVDFSPDGRGTTINAKTGEMTHFFGGW